MNLNSKPEKTHRDLLPKYLCPSLMMKQILISALDDPVYDDREEAGDGYCWCAQTCRDVGPDDQLVSPNMCGPQRSCFQSPVIL